ncbi:ubiquitin thioesterase OTU1, partial [Lecanoromycetidae sp. Uapishka_2]
MRVRIRGPAGQATISLPDTATVLELRSQITDKTSITDYDLKYGYPPKPLSLLGFQGTTRLQEIGVKLDGEQLIVSESVGPSSNLSVEGNVSHQPNNSSMNGSSNMSTPSSSFANAGGAPPSTAKLPQKPTLSEMDTPEIAIPIHASTMVLRVMPDDNSCLFRAFNTAFFGAMDNMHELRSIIAQNIQANKEVYSAVVLEKTPDDYCRWIQTNDSWGGAIELDVLSRHFDVEICSIDVQTLRADKFNEGKPLRCILVYSGIHYDTIALSPSDPPHTHAYAPPDFDTKMFDSADPVVLEGAIELCRILQKKHYYTDTAGFSVRCNICGKVSIGEKGATEHAAQTGHYDFGEAG